MKEGIRILLAGAVGLLAFAGPGLAQKEQWLQYHCQREARQITSNMGIAVPKMTIESPQGVRLPQFGARRQYFAEWSTPMVPSGGLWMALDKTKEQGHWDRLFIDSDGDGSLSDETPVMAYRIEQYYTCFGPVKVVFDGEDGPIVYHLNLRFYDRDEQNRRLYVYSGCWYEGDITVAGAKKRCVLIDHNVNGTFDDKAREADNCDRIRIGTTSSQQACYVGKYIDVEGVLYHLEIARDGAYIIITKAEDVVYGDVQVPEAITEFSAGGKNGLFTVKPEKGVASLPVGEYRIDYWLIDRSDDQGQRWMLKGGLFTSRGSFEVTNAKNTRLSIGEPVYSALSARETGTGYSFRQELKGRLGERIELARNGALPRAPKLHIKNRDGSYDRNLSFEYG